MSFESPDMAKDFPGLYRVPEVDTESHFDEDDKPSRRKDVLARRRESRPERRGKGYRMFEEEDSEEELVAEDTTRSPSKMKKHSKPSFKFTKRDKFYKPKEKDKDRDGDQQYGQPQDREQAADKHDKADAHREGKKKEDKLRWRKRKLLGPAVGASLQKSEHRTTADPQKQPKPIFGVPLAVAVERNKSHDGIQLPVIFRECVDYIEEFGLACEGIYRISGVKSKVTALKDQYNQHLPVYLHEHEPNIVASLLKLFLRELPEPVLTKELMPKFEEASTQKNIKQKVELFQQLIEQLPTPNKLLLSWMIVHMTHVIAKEKQNKMSLQNVSIVLSPTMRISHRVLNVLFTYSRILFKDTVLKRYVPPLKPVTSKWSLDLPESPSALEEELCKQESLLNQLHEDVMKRKDTDKEEQLWEVQRVVTQLKRKIKLMKKSQERDLARQQEILEQKQNKQKEEESEQNEMKIEPKQEKSEDERNESKQKQMTSDTELKIDDDGSKQHSEDKLKTNLDNKEQVSEVSHSKEEEKEEEDKETTVNAENTKDKVEIVEKLNSEEGAEDAHKSGDDKEHTEAGEGDNIPDDESNKKTLEEKDDESTAASQEQQPSEKEFSERLSDAVADQKETHVEPEDGHKVEPNHDENDGRTSESQGLQIEYPSLPECPTSRKVSTSSDEEVQQEEKIQVEIHAEAEQKTDSPEDHNLAQAVDLDENTDVENLQQQYNELLLEEEELLAMGDELRQKIETEQSEIGRLDQEIAELKSIREDLYDSDEICSDSSEDGEDEDDLQDMLRELVLKNQQLEMENQDLSAKIQQERQVCLNVKVQIRMIQQRQLESSGGMLLMDGISERDALIESLL